MSRQATCEHCQTTFEVQSSRGRLPRLCPQHRASNDGNVLAVSKALPIEELCQPLTSWSLPPEWRPEIEAGAHRLGITPEQYVAKAVRRVLDGEPVPLADYRAAVRGGP